ncbi:MAG: RnfABCDGE type electron transport complex subunit B [Pirellulaceae bacterium]|nr:RnfABCDGE type electron transport complex subunit B [Pirellulaceae bacterium]
MWISVLLAMTTMLLLAAVCTAALVAAQTRLAVHVDPRQQELESLLPQANCGGCGFASCAAYARAVHRGLAAVDRCSVGGPAVAERLAAVMGVELHENYPYRPVLHCTATRADRLRPGRYVGPPTCAAADVVGGVQGCTFGCLGLGDCVAACDYEAMEMVDGLPRIRYDNCIGCGACVRACPRHLFEQIPFKVERMLVVGCANRDPGKSVREVCRVGCIGCGLCARQRPEVISMENHLARIDYHRYTGGEDWAAVADKCPTKSLVLLGRPTPRHEQQLEDVPPVTFAGPPARRGSASQQLEWRG